MGPLKAYGSHFSRLKEIPHRIGKQDGIREGQQLGVSKGFEIGQEAGFYAGCLQVNQFTKGLQPSMSNSKFTIFSDYLLDSETRPEGRGSVKTLAPR